MNLTWQEPPAEAALPVDEVHVWRVFLRPSTAVREKLTRILAPGELERAARFYFDRDRHAFVVARGFMRSVLGRYLNVAPEQVTFTYGEHGKPTLSGTMVDLQFNLSHAGDWALLAVAYGRVVGVDIEKIRVMDDGGKIAARFFSASENVAWQAVPDSQKAEAFFNCWTRKEAFIKAIGDGLSYPLDRFDVSLVPGEPAQLLGIAGDATAAAQWRLQALQPVEGYAAAVIATGHHWRLQCFHWQAQTGNNPADQ